jgi:hypothetical protein
MVNMITLTEAAEKLAAADPASAVAQLREHTVPRDEVSGRHAMAVAQALLDDWQVDQAVEHLHEAIAKSAAPTRLRKMLTAALILNGDIDGASEAFYATLTDGLTLSSLTFVQKHLLRDTLRQREPASPLIDELGELLKVDQCVYDTDHRVALIYCGKNACSVLKATVVMNSPLRELYETEYQAVDKAIHDFCVDEMDGDVARELWRAPDTFRFTVLRDPTRRLLSGYLDKFMGRGKRKTRTVKDRNNTIRRAQAMQGIAFDLDRSISFEEFCRFLAVAHDLEMNRHWMPQTRIVGDDLSPYNFVGHMEKLNETFTMLKEKFHYVPQEKAQEHLGGVRNNRRKLSATPAGVPAYRMLPSELWQHRLGSSAREYPSASEFLTPDLVRVIEDRFSGDVRLRREATQVA